MAIKLDDEIGQPIELSADFSERLAASLERADQERRRHLVIRRVRAVLLLVLLVGPVIGWHLMLTTPDGVHITIGVLAWITSALDVGVHLDSSVLAYLGLQPLPSIVGVLLLVMVTATLLGCGREEQ